jgi:hypothetical protein
MTVERVAEVSVKLDTPRVLDPYCEAMERLSGRSEVAEDEVRSLASDCFLVRAGVAALHYFYVSERDREV